MVVNEVTSSVQAKGTKTVVAAAVAALMAGGAMAAEIADETVIGADQAVVVTGSAVSAVTGTVKHGSAEDARTDVKKEDTFKSDDATLKLEGGAFTLSAKDTSGATAAGVLTFKAINVAKDGSTINVTARNATNDSDKLASTLTSTAAINIAKNATIKFDHIGSGDKLGDATLTSGAAVTLGVNSEENAKQVNIVVTEGTSAKLEGTAVTLNNVSLANAGKFTVTGTTTLDAVDFTKNTGAITFASASTVIGTVVNGGKIVFADAFTVKDTNDGASFQTGNALMAADGEADTLFKGNVTVEGVDKKLGTFTADSLKINNQVGTTFDVKGYGVADIKNVEVTKGIFKVEANGESTIGTLTVAKDGTLTLAGKNTIGNLAIANSSTSTIAGETSVTEALTVGASNATAASGLAINGGKFSAGSVTIIGNNGAASTLTIDANTDEDKISLGDVVVGNYGTLTVTAAKNLSTNSVKVVGEESKAAAMTITAGDEISLGDVTVGKAGRVTDGGNTTVNNLTLTDGATYASTESLTIDGKLAVSGEGSGFTLTSGSLTTAYSNILSSALTETSTDVKLVDGITLTNGTLSLTGVEKYTKEEHKAITDKLTTITGLHLSGNFVGKDGALGAWSDVSAVGGNVEKSVIGYEIPEGTLSITDQLKADYTLGSLTITQKNKEQKVTAITISGDSDTLTLRGDANGNLINIDGVTKADAFALTLNKVTLGQEAEDVGTYTGDVTVGTDNLTVKAGSFTLGNLLGNGTVSLTVNSDAGLAVLGKMTETTYTPSGEDAQPVKYKALSVGTAGSVTLAQNTFFAAGDYLAPAAAKFAELKAAAGETANVSLLYIGEETTIGKVTGVNTTYVDLQSIVDNGYTVQHNNGIVKLAESVTDQTAGKIIADNLNAAVVKLDKNGNATINFGNFFADDTAVDFGNVFYENGTIKSGISQVLVDEIEVADLNDVGFNSAPAVENGIRSFTAPTNPIAATIYNNWGDWEDQAEKLVAEGLVASGLLIENTKADVIEGMSDEQLLGYVTAGNEQAALKLRDQLEEQFFGKLVNEENTATNLAVAGGAFNAALDVNDQVTAAIDRRTSLADLNAPRTEGFTPWVDVFGTANENEAYEADIYGAVLGFDYTASCGGVFGAAFNVGTADSNSANNATKVDNDSDFYGFSIYGAQTFGDFNVKADFGYTKLKNELSANTAFFGAVSEKLDSDVLTFGVGAEYLVKFGQLNVVPHAGLRVSRLSMDDSQYGASYDDMTVYQMPMGVAFSGTFETNGWQLAPMVDVTVVPAFGDKNAIATYFGGIEQSTRVVDTNPIQVKLGVEAQNGAFTFGVNYGLLAGSDDRMNNSFNANVRYTF